MKYLIWIVLILVVVGGAWYAMDKKPSEFEHIVTFEDCVAAGFPILESFPRQCTTPDGRNFVEDNTAGIVYTNSSSDLIRVELPFPGAVVGKEFSVIGIARGNWFFEASFPVELIAENGSLLATGIAEAQPDPETGEVNWMTTDFVPFKADLVVPESYIGRAALILHKDNASGLPEHDASMVFNINIEY